MADPDGLALLTLAITLGVKHGLDADHLVAVDALTRFNLDVRPKFARWCGVVFSLGHGAVVIAVAVLAGLLAGRWEVPEGFRDLGAWISILFLAALGVLNLWAVWRTPRGAVVQPVGMRGRLLRGLMRTSRPGAVALVGALFALSFDTLSQAALLSLAAQRVATWQFGVVLALGFVLGMTAADGVNGLYVASLLRAADRRAPVASRVMGITVGALSLAIAALGAWRYASPTAADWLEGRELATGIGMLVAVAAAFLIALALAGPRRASPVSGVGLR
jgi:high-affinity nickel-transport protein